MSDRHGVNPLNRKGKETVTSPIVTTLTEDRHSPTQSDLKPRVRARAPDRGDTPKGVTPPCLYPEPASLPVVTDGLRGLRPSSSRPAVAPDSGRVFELHERLKAVRRGLRKREARLRKSMAHIPEPRPGDVARWDRLRAEIAEFQKTLADLLAGRSPPLSPRTGEKTRELPDAV